MNLIAAALAGVLSWSLLEYCIHRWLGHVWTRNIFGREHTAHHSRGDYFAATWKKGAAALAVVALVTPPAVWLLGREAGIAYGAGLAGFYLCYELLHRLEHVWRGIGPYARWARRHHFIHHFHDPRVNHGVTSPIWDLVFGTYRRPTVVQVPEKLKMGWLCDPRSGEIWPDLRRDYALRRLRPRRQAES